MLHIQRNLSRVIADISTHRQVFQNGHAGKHAATFWHHGQALFDQIPGAFAFDALTEVLDITVLERQGACDGFHGRRFTSAVRTDQGDQFTFTHFKIDAFDRLNTAVTHFESADFEKNICHVMSFGPLPAH